MPAWYNPGSRPNGLLWILVCVSLLIHLGLVYTFQDFWRFRPHEKIIEVELPPPRPVGKRKIPRPPAAQPDFRTDASLPADPENPPEQALKNDPQVVAEEILQWKQPAREPPDQPEPQDRLEPKRSTAPPARAKPAARPMPARPVKRAEKPGQGAQPNASDNAGKGADAADRGRYFRQVRLAIERNRQYPLMARRQQLEGRVTVSFTIDANGAVSDLFVARGSGFSVLDEAALSAVRAAGPFSAPPPHLAPPLTIEIPIVFRLRR